MGMQDRDYVRERKLDYTSKYDRKPQKKMRHSAPTEIPAWVFVVCGFGAIAIIWYIGTHYH